MYFYSYRLYPYVLYCLHAECRCGPRLFGKRVSNVRMLPRGVIAACGTLKAGCVYGYKV